MNNETKNRVCPVERAGGLDNIFRKIFQNPRKILAPYIRKDMTVLDLGCGPGFFTLEIARMLNASGRVIAADLQQGMLDKVFARVNGSRLGNVIELHKCEPDSIGLKTKFDFILAFYVVHEVPDQEKLFNEFDTLLKPGGKLFIAEPSFHVSEESFTEMTDNVLKRGFRIIGNPKIVLSKTIVMQKSE